MNDNVHSNCRIMNAVSFCKKKSDNCDVLIDNNCQKLRNFLISCTSYNFSALFQQVMLTHAINNIVPICVIYASLHINRDT